MAPIQFTGHVEKGKIFILLCLFNFQKYSNIILKERRKIGRLHVISIHKRQWFCSFGLSVCFVLTENSAS